MYYKKFFSAAALATLLSLSQSAFSDPVGVLDEDEDAYYVRLQYNGDLFNIMNEKEVKGKEDVSGLNSNPERSAIGWSKDGAAAADYRPKYKSSLLNGSVAFGYNLEGIRVELEGLYSHVDLDTAGYKSGNDDAPDNAKHLELVRDVNDSKSKGSSPAFFDSSSAGKVIYANGIDKLAFKMENKGFTNIAGMINAYYDVDLGSDTPLIPYVGGGVGVTRVEFLGTKSFKPAYQGKAGVSYAFDSGIKVFAGARYFGIFGDEYKEVKPTTELKRSGGNTNFVESTTATVKHSFGVYGLEAGVMFSF
ncbi:P44/Msp2 family outer membrane protein [Wolbachia endosymbiont of Pentidionis agamae]|uniref:P44/Msp2 family outer membrane protein n=1 Tax=Wolbachia endosymbiont of Pentidionis agamae TaxID=3110435 RepID=UPI002FD2BCCB